MSFDFKMGVQRGFDQLFGFNVRAAGATRSFY
jgi:hypothetical protein